jgi:hypothetical protein
MEIVMTSSSTHPRLKKARNALVWLVAIVLAVFPFPWWW